MIEETARQALAETQGNETILLVEDEHVMRLMLVEILTSQGYAVLDAGRGADALALAQGAAKPVDLLVTDMSMPGMTGWDLARSLRAIRPGLPVLFVSGHNEHETAQWGRLDPPVEHLFKPFSMEAFLYKARQMLDLRKMSASERPLEKTGAANPSTLL
jgi:CheY-like chemotaxis protein